MLLFLIVPCPFFAPTKPADWIGTYPRLPLGEAWEGECGAGEAGFEPQGVLLFEACNTGYGRTRCPRFPADSTRDSVRFHVTGAAGDKWRMIFVYERDCRPVEHGELEVEKTGGAALGDGEILMRQARAYARTHAARGGR